ncbi:hypothetical protein E1B28_005863 [Marasmius oreades]|uniref:Uncharacterized protein n=1 Tax=Marasmius oreades TaxID=181124 RepID=A0A9P7UW97_9AGAR|nr:uncharacterized protein E1B28_005863 [Marasmius oreades]KAG7095074.1 hypothetical protein E1B28_005863 [Marasmius oreades]
MSSRDAKASIVAFPTLSSSLNALPNATNLQGLPLHPNMYAQRAAESEAKLQRSFQSKSGSSPQNLQSALYTMPSSSSSCDHTLMMRKPQKSK